MKGGRKGVIFLGVFLFFFFLPTDSSSTNECGGNNLLTHRVGDFCDAKTEDCPFGLVECVGKEKIICSPNCSITVQIILDEVTLKGKRNSNCLNGGFYREYWDDECTCPYGFLGSKCETKDDCLNLECGNNGECLNGKCTCDFLYTGTNCEIRKDCSAPRFQWTGSHCVCRNGFTGDRCDKCVEGLVCLPIINSPHEYEAVIISDHDLLKDLLEKDKPDGYDTKPYIPTPYPPHYCQCSSSSSLLSYSLSVESFSGLDGLEKKSDYNLYVHHFHRFHYGYKSNTIIFYVFAGILFILLLLGIFCNWRNTNKPTPVPEYPISQPLTPSPSFFNSQQNTVSPISIGSLSSQWPSRDGTPTTRYTYKFTS